MQNNDFFMEKQKAVERMKEMQQKYNQKNGGMPPAPFFVSTAKPDVKEEKTKGSGKDIALPFLSGFDSDISLILGLVLLLSNEGSDRLLLYALIYILL